MNILNRVKEDLLSERKKSSSNILMISTVLSEVSFIGKNAGNRETNDSEALALVKRMVKNNKETISMVDADKAIPYVAENEYLSKFIPKEASDEDVLLFVKHCVESIETPSMKDMGSIMAQVKSKFDGNYDGKKISGFVRSALS